MVYQPKILIWPETHFLRGILDFYGENSKKKRKWYLPREMLKKTLAKFEAPAKQHMEFQKPYFKRKSTPNYKMIEKALETTYKDIISVRKHVFINF